MFRLLKAIFRLNIMEYTQYNATKWDLFFILNIIFLF